MSFPPPTPRPIGRATRAAGAVGLTLVGLVMLGALAGRPATPAAPECRYTIVDDADPAGTRAHSLRVGEVERPAHAGPLGLVNHGPHDIRLTFDGASPRVLLRGQREPAAGRLPPRVRLLGVECLPSRAAAATPGDRRLRGRLA